MKKQPKPWAEDIEKAIEKAFWAGKESGLAENAKAMTECYELASKIMQRMAGYQPPLRGQVNDDGTLTLHDKPAPKRKAMTASDVHLSDALEVLCRTEPRYSALTPKNVAAVWRSDKKAYRLAGAALKALVADGRATVKRGKYAQAQPTVDNGLSQTPALSGQS